MATKLYRIMRDVGRQIGVDLLVVSRGGTYFLHPSVMRNWEKIFEANLATCRALAAQIGECSIVDQKGRAIK